MNTTQQLSYIAPNFLETIAFPAVIFVVLTAFLDNLTTYINQGLDIHNPNMHDMAEIHRDLETIISLAIRMSERILSINQTDPLVPVIDQVTRYENLLRLHEAIEDIHDILQRLISLIERGTLANGNDPVFNNLCQQFGNDGDRLRLAGNALVSVMRRLETVIWIYDPLYQFLTRQWFES